jgi:hypothetical protein
MFNHGPFCPVKPIYTTTHSLVKPVGVPETLPLLLQPCVLVTSDPCLLNLPILKLKEFPVCGLFNILTL